MSVADPGMWERGGGRRCGPTFSCWGFGMPIQGCPINGKICFLRICIACFILGQKNNLCPNLRIFSYSVRLLPPPPPFHFHDRGILRKKPIFGRIYVFFRTEFGYYPPPPPRYTRGISRAPSEPLRLRPKSQDFSEFRLGNPAHFGNNLLKVGWKSGLWVADYTPNSDPI